MRIAFIVSAYRTILFHGVGQRLEKAGHEVYWLSPNRRWARWLAAHGHPPERTFDVTEFGREWRDAPVPTAEDVAELRQLEVASGCNAYDVIQMCDLLRHRPRDYAVRYLAVCARRLREFLSRHAIDFVSGELTWAFELVVGQVCDQLGIPFLRPFYLRIPEDRFVFFPGRCEKDALFFREPGEEDRDYARRLLKGFREGQKFAYMSFNSLIVPVTRWDRVRLILKHLWDVQWDPYDETTLRPLPLLGKHLAMVLRNWRNRRLRVFEPVKLPPQRPFVFVTLHLEPEMTINVMGNPFTNQVELVRAMARRLPVTHDLWVKEHRVALAKRPREVYTELAAIPGVRLIDPFVSSLTVMRHADLVVAVTGTATYEAALLGVPSMTMAPTVFGPVLVSDHFNPFTDSLGDVLDRVRGKPPRTDEELLEFLAWAHAQSWPGSDIDPLWNPASVGEENLERLTAAFCAALARGREVPVPQGAAHG
jgi:hypothetical protein